MNNHTTLSDRLRFALKTLEISQSDLAKKINVKPQVIQYLCAGNSEKSKFVFDIAEALNIDILWLISGKGNAPVNSKIIPNDRVIPLLSFEQIRDIKIYNNNANPIVIPNWLPISSELSLSSFACVLNDRSMSPKFDLDSTVIIDPTIKANSYQNSYVLAYIKSVDFIIFRELRKIKERNILVPLNKSLYKEIELTKNDSILGVCKEARWKNLK